MKLYIQIHRYVSQESLQPLYMLHVQTLRSAHDSVCLLILCQQTGSGNPSLLEHSP